MKPIVKKVLGLVVVVSALASVVAGREQPSYQPARKSAARTDTRAPAAADIDLAKLAARADEGATTDAFARRSFAPIVPAAEAQPQAPAKPTAPPLPATVTSAPLSPRKAKAVPKVGCPANGNSSSTVKMRTRTPRSHSMVVRGRMKVVSERFVSLANACICASVRPRPSRTTASAFPSSGVALKTSI